MWQQVAVSTAVLACAYAAAATAAAATAGPDLVQIVHRHGDRAPIVVPPALASAWNATQIGPGELSAIGKQMLRGFGRLLRARYVDGTDPTTQQLPILSKSGYDYRQLLVRSSDVDRTLQSVTELLSRLYPGDSIPIHTVPQRWDNLLQSSDHCASFASAYDTIDNALSAQWNANATITALVNACLQWTGWSADYAQGYEGGVSGWLSMVADNLACAQAHGIYVTPQVQAQADLLRALHRDINYANFGPATAVASDDPRGALGNELGTTVMANIDEFRSGANTARKMFIYSAHDDTVTAMYTALGALLPVNFAPNGDPLTPPYATAVVIEYYSARDGQPDRVLLRWGDPVRNSSVADPAADYAWSYALHELSVPCNGWVNPSDWTATCSYADQFVPLVQSVTVAGGCCVKAMGWDAEGCAQNYSAPTNALSPQCALYRQWCPASSCDEGQILTYGSQVCVDLGRADATAGMCYRWLLLGLAFSAAVAVGVWCFNRAPRKADADAAPAAPQHEPLLPAMGRGSHGGISAGVAVTAGTAAASASDHKSSLSPPRVGGMHAINSGAGVGVVSSAEQL